jgi:predicted RNase H-like nuclease (RuvC/YqgF family)
MMDEIQNVTEQNSELEKDLEEKEKIIQGLREQISKMD